MSGKMKGVQAHISKIEPLAVYTHCASHRLNLALSKACVVPSIRNCDGVISSVANFFRESAGRKSQIERVMEACLPEDKRRSIKKHVKLRWVERHKAVLTFLDIFPSLSKVLEEMVAKGDKTGATACSLLNAIKASEFLVSLVVLAEILGVTLPLARDLQAEKMDTQKSMELVEATEKALQKQRDEEKFNSLFQKANDLAKEFDEEIRVPRLTSRQTGRSNATAASTEEYYRLSIFYPFVDYLISETASRFPRDAMVSVRKLQKKN